MPNRNVSTAALAAIMTLSSTAAFAADAPAGSRGAVLADVAEGDLTIAQWMEKAERRAVNRHLQTSRLKSLVKSSA